MPTSNPNNLLPTANLGQIVADLQTFQQDISAHCADSSQQLRAAMDQLQALSQFISTTMSVLQTAYDGLAVLQHQVAAGTDSPAETTSPATTAAAPVDTTPVDAASTDSNAADDDDSKLTGISPGDDPVVDSGQPIVESIKNISALLNASAQKPVQQ